MTRVTALTAQRSTPSAWFRVGQTIEELRHLGIETRWLPARVSTFPPRAKWLRPLWLPMSVASRFSQAAASWRGEITWLAKEMVSTLVTWEPITRRPRVLDVDDAIWLHRGGRAARAIARRVDCIVVGNSFLADWFSQHNANVIVIPTAVDTSRFLPRSKQGESRPIRSIGWTGTSGNLKYLYAIESPLLAILQQHPDTVLRVICDRPPVFRGIPSERLQYVRWTREREVGDLQSLDVGLMPLDDTDWERGKCALKLLLYMACGIPVIASPVGVNREILSARVVGFSARRPEEWQSALDTLVRDPELGRKLGSNGRRLVENSYSVRRVARQLAKCFLELSKD